MRNQLLSVVRKAQRGPVIYPFLFAVFPMVFLWAQNVEEFSVFAGPVDILVPIAISLAITAMAVGLGILLLRNTRKAALIAFLFLLAFFSYGHVYDILIDAEFVDVPRTRFFLVIWAVIFLAVGLAALKIRADLQRLTNALNVIFAVLILISLVNIAVFHLSPGTDLASAGINGPTAAGAAISGPGALPDIYYIVPDAYTSANNLKEVGFDNSPFIDYLTGKDFYVASDSRPNYAATKSSLASSLNMRHLTYLTEVMPKGSTDGTIFIDMIRENEVMGILRSHGYKVIHTRGGWISDEYGDTHLSCEGSSLTSFHADDFSGALIRTTVLEPVLKFFDLVESRLAATRLCDFSMIIEAKQIPGPKFVFAHLFVPHPPYIFDRNGEKVSASLSTTDYSEANLYIDQLIFINKQLRKVVDALLSGTGNSPIIIIQGDHGTAFHADGHRLEVYRERMGILNAYHWPGGGDQLLYQSITPVNTFRLMFNYYFGTGYELLDDLSYYSNPREARFEYLDVTGLVSARQAPSN